MLITCAAKDQDLLPLVLRRLIRHGRGLVRVLVVPPQPPPPMAGLAVGWLNDDQLPLKKAWLASHLSEDLLLGWWQQQLVKLLALQWWPQLGDRLLVWDGESVLFRPLGFQGYQGRVLIHPSSELHGAYTEHIVRFLPGPRR